MSKVRTRTTGQHKGQRYPVTRRRETPRAISRPLGQCFNYTHSRALRAQSRGEDITIVHAKVQSKWDSKPYDHAWIETGDGIVQDWQTMEMGSSKFAGVGWDRDIFYEHYNPKNIRTYTPKEVIVNTQKHGHTGPWRI